jgi:5-methylcytosine-specific restriction protein A
MYGEGGKGFIEVHHLHPLGDNTTTERITDPAKDLIVVCANCHWMIHRKKGITLTLDELKQKINPVYSNE